MKFYTSVAALVVAANNGEITLFGEPVKGDNGKNSKLFARYHRDAGEPIVVRVNRKGDKNCRISVPGSQDDPETGGDRRYLVPINKLSDFESIGDQATAGGSTMDLEAILASAGEDVDANDESFDEDEQV